MAAKKKKAVKAKKAAKKKTAKPASRKAAKKIKTAAKKVKKAAGKAVKKAAPKKKAKKPAVKKQIVGEGDYAASRSFLGDQAKFVKKNKAKIPAMGKAAEAALDGPEGASLRAAEAEAAGHSKTSREE
jgi:adenylate kinase